jgi:aspartyl-tRNA(Asn)/glutamyl-tRNA(Gln) amidotransferase subunit A
VSVAELAGRLRRGELSPREAVQGYLDRIERLNEHLNAYVALRAEEALAEARALERSDARGPLWGVPVAVKDVIDVAGTPTEAGSRILAGSVPSRDAAAIERLRRAGAIVLGKLNTHEFAYGATTTSAHAGPARNPWDRGRICGGSSGGSAAAAAAGLAAGTLGTDTAGSIRIPACLCGVTGLRPSTGRVSNRGVVPVSWTFDTVGPIARSAEDCALLLEAIAGPDPEDPTTVGEPVPPYAERLRAGIVGLRVGLVRHLFERGVEPAVAEAVEAAAAELSAAGAALVDVRARELDTAGVAQQLVMLPEATAVHAERLRTRLADYGADVRARLLAGLFLPATAYVTGQRTRRALFERALALFEQADVLVAPAMPAVAPPIGAESVLVDGAAVPYRLALIPFNSPWSFLGLPAASVPAGFVDGLPVGMAIVGPRLGEELVLRAAHAFQRLTDWHRRGPFDSVADEALTTSTTTAEKGG